MAYKSLQLLAVLSKRYVDGRDDPVKILKSNLIMPKEAKFDKQPIK